MRRIFTIIVMFAVMSNIATGWKRRGHHDFHHNHNGWNMEGNGHFPTHHGEHDGHYHGHHNWDDSNKPYPQHWGHREHSPYHDHPHHDWGGNHGNWDGNKGHWGGNHGNWGGNDGNWGGDNGDWGGNDGNWGGNNGNSGGDNVNWGGNNGDSGGDNGNRGANGGDSGENNGNWDGNKDVSGGDNSNWGGNKDISGGDSGNWGGNNADRDGNNGNWVDNNPSQISNNGDSDGIKDEGGNQITDSQWPIIERSTPTIQLTPMEEYPVSTEQFPIPTEQFPIRTEQFPGPTEQLPDPTEQFTVPTESLPVPTEQLPNPTEQFPNPTLSSSSSTILPSSPAESISPTSQNIDDCERSCLVTSEYYPVCGTNYRTYNNMGRLLCAQECGVDVKLFMRRACPSLNIPTTARAVVSNGLTGVGAGTYTAVQCIMSCNITEEDNPVCGSDGITYDNPSMILCAQTCGYSVTIESMSACSAVNSDTLRNEVQTTPVPYTVKACINSCSSSTEYNPVCGTNGVTYQNPGLLNCAALCGIDVEIRKRSPCSSSTNNGNFNNNFNNNNFNSNNPVTMTTTAPEVVPSRAQLAACMRSCPQTPEYNPVCGTNGVTYNNAGHLSCAQACGISVELKRNSVCPRPVPTQPPESDLPASPVTNQQLPITQSTSTTTEYTPDSNGPVNGADIINIPSTQPPNVSNENPPANGSATTIPSELLLSIFTQPATTTPEPDEEFDLDPRYGEDKRQ